MKAEFDGNNLINSAIEMAAKAHNGQCRKVSDIPYIVHPFEVAMILQENGIKKEVIAAGILHDTLEDTNVTPEDIKEKFGEEILRLVLGASEELEDRNRRPWKERKIHTIESVKNVSEDILCITCADKLSNIRSMIKDYNEKGEKLWSKFNAPYEEQKWYYENLVKSLERLEGYKMYDQFKVAVDYLFFE